MSPFPLPTFFPIPDFFPSAPEQEPSRRFVLMICPEQGLDLSHPLAKIINAVENAMDDNPTLKLTINLIDPTRLEILKGE